MKTRKGKKEEIKEMKKGIIVFSVYLSRLVYPSKISNTRYVDYTSNVYEYILICDRYILYCSVHTYRRNEYEY